ncbi:MAG: fatty acid desaturase, partial [Actinomycetota bacterium]|nr:fatty acid desaturase [Actinomycetota bacterium]
METVQLNQPGPRDYGLTGPDSQRAVDNGLADAQWYRPPIDPARLQALMTRRNGRTAVHTGLWLVLLVGAGVIAYRTLGSWWAVPAFAVYGALYGGAADPRWHETGHGTAFRSRLANDVVYPVASFMLLREPTLWRWSHFRHHSDTIIVGRDPEIAFPRPFKLRVAVPNYLHILNGPAMLKRMVAHAFGRVDGDARSFVPEHDLRRLVWEARIFVAVLAGVVGWSLATWSIVPLLFVGLPSFYGVWLVLFFGMT